MQNKEGMEYSTFMPLVTEIQVRGVDNRLFLPTGRTVKAERKMRAGIKNDNTHSLLLKGTNLSRVTVCYMGGLNIRSGAITLTLLIQGQGVSKTLRVF